MYVTVSLFIMFILKTRLNKQVFSNFTCYGHCLFKKSQHFIKRTACIKIYSYIIFSLCKTLLNIIFIKVAPIFFFFFFLCFFFFLSNHKNHATISHDKSWISKNFSYFTKIEKISTKMFIFCNNFFITTKISTMM